VGEMDKKKYDFLLIEDRLYINAEQRLINLFLNLYFKAMPFDLFQRRTSNKLINFFPSLLIRGIRILQFCHRFYRQKKIYNKAKVVNLISTGYYGHCLLELRLGEYKIINLKEKEVITVFSQNAPYWKLEEKINTIKQSGKCKLAPNLKRWKVNKDDCYLVEEYINSVRPSYNLYSIKNINTEIFPTLKEIMTTTKPKSIRFDSYIRALYDRVEFYFIKLRYRISDKDISKIKIYFCEILDKLKDNQIPQELFLVFSHGDFWEGNILYKNKVIRVIDWTTLDYRSSFFDFFYFMFMVASKNKPIEIINEEGLFYLEKVIDNTFNSFFKEIIEDGQGISFLYDNLKIDNNSFRHLFYLELILLKLKELDNCDNKDIKDLLIWIKRFEMFEEERSQLSAVTTKTNTI
jgi:thiamine kinase-like enzyme